MRGNYLLTMALLASAACGDSAGTSTGNPSPRMDAGPDAGEETDNDGLAAGGYCNAGDDTPLGLDEDSPLGFSPNDILAFVEGEHEAPLRWNPQMGVTYGPETADGRITITVTPKGTARYVEPAEPGNADIDIGLPAVDTIGGCTAWVEIDVDVNVASEGGALDESFEAIVRTHTTLTASLYASLEPDELGGAFEVTVSDTFEGFMLTELYLNVTFSTFGVGGTFHGLLELRTDDAVGIGAAGSEPFADFGFTKCNGGGFAVGVGDEIEGVTVQDALDAFAARDEVDVTWEDGTTTTSSLAFAADDEGGCVLLDNEMVGDLSLVIHGVLTMVSEDGQLEGEWPGRLEAHVADDGSLERIVFLLSDRLSLSIASGAAAYGFPEEDISSYDAAGVSVGMSLSGDVLSGSVTLTGYADADCAMPEPPDAPDDGSDPDDGFSTPGCRGADPTILASGALE